MKFATSVHALTDFAKDEKPFHETLADAAECGFDGIMLMNFPGKAALTPGARPPCSLIDLEASDPATVREALHEARLDLATVYEGCMKVATEQEARDSAAALGKLIGIAEELGASVVLPNAGSAPAAGMPVAEKEDLIRRVAWVLMTALEDAPPDMRLAIDVHYGGAVETVADCLRLFELATDVRAGIALNIGHMTTCREEGWLLARDRPERIPVVAWKDHLLSPPPEATHPVYSVELGAGDAPFERYVDALRPDDGAHLHLITLEHVPLAEKKEALRRSLEYLRALWSH